MSHSLNHMVLPVEPAESSRMGRKPSWLKMKMPGGEGYSRLLKLVNEQRLHTVCQSAKCPNMGECWSAGTATIMILGDVCTRSCGFCHIATGRPPYWIWMSRNVSAKPLQRWDLAIASSPASTATNFPTAAQIWAETIRQVRKQSPGTNIEVLIPDFCGNWPALQKVLDEKPEILNHNIETVPRLYPQVRPQAKYRRSLELLQIAKRAGLVAKTGMMLGLGEEEHEIEAVLDDLVSIGCDILTLGQYLQPTHDHLPVERWVHPDEFVEWKSRGELRGLRHVEAGPLVRSSYHAEKQVKIARVNEITATSENRTSR